jgi:mono/diheme cytochrome c family protein
MTSRAISYAVLLASTAALTACDRNGAGSQPVSYAEDVAPILQKHCAECHVAGKEGTEATGLRVDSYAALMKGSQDGPVIKPGKARTSSLYILITAGDHLTVNMPRGREPLSAGEIETLRAWIDEGAPEN